MTRGWASLWLGLALAACAPAVDLGQAPGLRPGEEVCDQCQMIISEVRFGGALWTRDGEARRFDDIGCLLDYVLAHNENHANCWFHDHLEDRWLTPDQAAFVKSPRIHTPMASGLVALNGERQARAVANEKGGEVLTFAELLDELRRADN